MSPDRRYYLAEHHEICPGCNSLLPRGRRHPPVYLNNSSGCWAIYGEVIERHIKLSSKTVLYRLLADTYAVQHPRVGTHSADRILAIHLSTLYLILQKGYGVEASTLAMKRIVALDEELDRLRLPVRSSDLTIVDVYRARSESEYEQTILDWSRSVWETWLDSWDVVRNWVFHA